MRKEPDSPHSQTKKLILEKQKGHGKKDFPGFTWYVRDEVHTGLHFL